MNVLDENIAASQRQLLAHWRVRARQIGLDIGRRGMADGEIIPLLLRLRRPTFFTRDDDFFDRDLCHSRYCLVYLAVHRDEVASFVRRLLRHPSLRTVAQRMGSIIRVSSGGLVLWRTDSSNQLSLKWVESR